MFSCLEKKHSFVSSDALYCLFFKSFLQWNLLTRWFPTVNETVMKMILNCIRDETNQNVYIKSVINHLIENHLNIYILKADYYQVVEWEIGTIKIFINSIILNSWEYTCFSWKFVGYKCLFKLYIVNMIFLQ